MRFSVVINTYNRGESLRTTLAALRHQTYPDFEVVVVNGPSADCTDAVLAEFPDARVYRCPEPHLSKSRNIGIAHAAGDVVAFIDDDGVPEPDWLAGLAAAYDAPDVGGAGGLVYDHTGVAYQYEYSACSRVAVPRFDLKPPFDAFCRPGADPFLYLQGTNCSFRRDVLIEIGGFNEEIEYYLDETEVCMRTIDSGYVLRSLPHAAVHHKYRPSHIRDAKRVVFDPYSSVKNHCTFAVRYGTQTRPLSEVLEEVNNYVRAVKAGGRSNREAGLLTEAQYEHYLRRTEQAVEFGVKQGLTKPRPVRHLPPAHPGQFRHYETLRPGGGPLKVCFVSREFPPDRGGIGRFTADLAEGYAARGHEVHVVTRSAAGHTVDFEKGVWVHRIPDVGPKGEAFRRMAVCHNVAHAANVYHEVARIHAARGGLDLVSAPVWLCEGAVCALDNRWPTVLSLHTTMQTIAAMGGTTTDPAHVAALVALEKHTARTAEFVYANSRASLAKARAEAGELTGTAAVVPHGTRDVRDRFPRRRPAGGKVRVLFVGRIEARKGVDVLLEAAYRVLPEFPAAELVLVGKHNPSGGENCLGRFAAVTAADPDLKGRITFAGEVSDDELMQHYADCDVFVLPSRYESFGLVLTEAMMFGKPVVAVRAGGPAEVVEDGGNGYLAAPDDPAALADALRKLLASADRRAAFGGRSRALYEQLFSTDVMVENTVAAHRQMIAAWAGRAKPEGYAHNRLEELLMAVAGATAADAAAASREMFSKNFRNPSDYPVQLADLWAKPDEEFLRGLYALILRRPADAEGLTSHLDHLRGGGTRAVLLEWMLFSEEAKLRRTDTSWYADFVPPRDPPREVPAAATAAPPRAGVKTKLRGLAGRAKRGVLRVPVLGRGLRLFRRAMAVPGAVRRLEARADDLAARLHDVGSQLKTEQLTALKQIRETQRELADGLRAVETQAAARDRQLHWVLSRQADGLAHLAGEPSKARAA